MLILLTNHNHEHFLISTDNGVHTEFVGTANTDFVSVRSVEEIIETFSSKGYSIKIINDFDIVMNNIFNPSLSIQKYLVKNNIYVNVVRDDLLIGGTKQRALYKLILANQKYNNFVYAGPTTGYAQLALSYCCFLLGKKCTIFTSGVRTKLTEKAAMYPGCTIIENTTLKEAQNNATAAVMNGTVRDGSSESSFLIPFGMDFKEYTDLLEEQLKIAAQNTQLYPLDKKFTLWLTVGSGTLLKVFSKVWPNATFRPVQVGKAIQKENYSNELWTRMGGQQIVDLLRVNPYSDVVPRKGHQYQEFYEEVPENLRPPYPALLTYDAKVWQRVLMYAKNDEYIWSTGAQID
jgi:hypothetical protein